MMSARAGLPQKKPRGAGKRGRSKARPISPHGKSAVTKTLQR
jgi:hypothetical protein